MLAEALQFSVEHLQALHGNVVRLHIVDADLQMVKSGTIQALDAIRCKQISIRDQRRNAAATANLADNVIKFGMEQRLATTDGDHGRAQFSESVDSAQHRLKRDWLGIVVELAAVSAR
jgi:hypothetical protein